MKSNDSQGAGTDDGASGREAGILMVKKHLKEAFYALSELRV
jgi:hypothetical protein